MKPKTQTYNDGLLTISKVTTAVTSGEAPVESPTARHTGVSYDDRTVGMSRFWQGKQLDVQIERMVRCPKLLDVHALDVVTTEDGQTYQIEQVQYPKGVEPPSMDLSLSLLQTRDDLDPPDPEEGEEP